MASADGALMADDGESRELIVPPEAARDPRNTLDASASAKKSHVTHSVHNFAVSLPCNPSSWRSLAELMRPHRQQQ